MSKDWDNVEYTILKERFSVHTIPVSQLRPGDIIKIPDEYSDRGTNGKVITKEIKHGRGHSKYYKFTILLANGDTFEFEKGSWHTDPHIIIIL